MAWLDNDILFTNPDWAVQTLALLDDVPAVQPYERVIHVWPGAVVANDGGPACESFAAVWGRDRGLIGAGVDRHGHPGFAWAARRELLERHGLYDVALNAGGDHLIAHAMCGDSDSPCGCRETSLGQAELIAHRTMGTWLYRMLRAATPLELRRWLWNRPDVTRLNTRYRGHYLAWA